MDFDTRKKVEMNGRIQYPLAAGEKAVIFLTDKAEVVYTSIVQDIEVLSEDDIMIGTMNTRYLIHLKRETKLKKPAMRKKLFGKC